MLRFQVRRPLAAIVVMLGALGAGATEPGGSAAAPPPWRESFDECRGGVRDALQWQSGVRLEHGAAIPGWESQGAHAVHVAEIGGGARAVLVWQDDRLTVRDPIDANGAGTVYRLSCDVGPAVYAAPEQATGADDGVVVEILRTDESVLAATTFLPGPWRGRALLERRSFSWTGDGTGPVRVRISAARREGRFGGAIDALEVGPDSGPAPADRFVAEVAPLLAARCLECHRGPGAEGGLDLSTAAGLATGGDGGDVVRAGDPDASLLWQRVAAGEMPPAGGLDEPQRRALHDWIAGGARWSGGPIDPFLRSTPTRAGLDWWSLRPLEAPAPPPGAPHPVDAFVAARLRAAGLEPSPPATPRDLVRRLYFDLVGLPPPPDAVAAFERDPTDAAWTRLVDGLLASDAHGERMARHWLDVARFGESDGYEHNAPRDHAWHYRDWLIRAFRDDLPYDEFVRLQIAGDVLAPGTLDGVAATGFLVAGVHNPVVGAGAAMREAARQDALEEIAGTVGQSFLGLSVHCARCHDHKYDPVATEDYYSFAATLAGVRHGTRPVAAAGGTIPVHAAVPGPAEPVHVLARGDVRRPGMEVVPAGLRAVGAGAASFGIGPGASDEERRRCLAGWLTGPAAAPLARVMVNRVWQWHFGRGIVDTPGDLGFNGGRPSHPELLEWLASWLRDHGWSLHALHRLILTSDTWRMASARRPEAEAVDAGNSLLWRQNPRRVEAEAFRDSLLACAGVLPAASPGPGYRDVVIREVPPTSYYVPFDADDPSRLRRTVYRFSPRGERGGLLDTFDCPDPSARTPRRAVTTTPGQVLSQWNDPFVLRMAAAMAARIERECPGPEGDRRDASWIGRAWRLALGRDPDPAEREAAVAHLRGHGLAAVCRVVFNTNEFIVVE